MGIGVIMFGFGLSFLGGDNLAYGNNTNSIIDMYSHMDLSYSFINKQITSIKV